VGPLYCFSVLLMQSTGQYVNFCPTSYHHHVRSHGQASQVFFSIPSLPFILRAKNTLVLFCLIKSSPILNKTRPAYCFEAGSNCLNLDPHEARGCKVVFCSNSRYKLMTCKFKMRNMYSFIITYDV